MYTPIKHLFLLRIPVWCRKHQSFLLLQPITRNSKGKNCSNNKFPLIIQSVSLFLSRYFFNVVLDSGKMALWDVSTNFLLWPSGVMPFNINKEYQKSWGATCPSLPHPSTLWFVRSGNRPLYESLWVTLFKEFFLFFIISVNDDILSVCHNISW